jgi:hypothetical protein
MRPARKLKLQPVLARRQRQHGLRLPAAEMHVFGVHHDRLLQLIRRESGVDQQMEVSFDVPELRITAVPLPIGSPPAASAARLRPFLDGSPLPARHRVCRPTTRLAGAGACGARDTRALAEALLIARSPDTPPLVRVQWPTSPTPVGPAPEHLHEPRPPKFGSCCMVPSVL